MQTIQFKFQIVETGILNTLKDTQFLDNCLDIFVDLCNEKEYKKVLGKLFSEHVHQIIG